MHALCPSIFGQDMVKAGLLLALCGGVRKVRGGAAAGAVLGVRKVNAKQDGGGKPEGRGKPGEGGPNKGGKHTHTVVPHCFPHLAPHAPGR